MAETSLYRLKYSFFFFFLKSKHLLCYYMIKCGTEICFLANMKTVRTLTNVTNVCIN